MKHLIFILASFCLFFGSITKAQQTYTVSIPGESHYIKWYSDDNSFESGSGYLGAGRNGPSFRSYIIWNNILSYVPANRQIAEVKFIITWGGHYSTAQIEYHDFSFGVGLPQNYSNIGTGTLWDIKPATITEYSFTQLTDKVQAAVNGGPSEVHIGIKNQNEAFLDYDKYVSYTYNVSLSVTYYSNQITVTQLDKDGLPFGQVGDWQGSSWLDENVPFNKTLSAGSILGLRSSQDFKSSTYQKYWQWTQNDALDIPNPHKFVTIYTGDRFEAKFKTAVEGITIENSLEGTTLNSGSVQFADPWYIDYADPLFGNLIVNNSRNRGMKIDGEDALKYRNRNSPFYPDYNTEFANIENGVEDPPHSYQGIFFNQNPTFDSEHPNYIVQSPTQPINLGGKYGNRTFYFNRWTGSGVQFEHSGNATTGVVFTSANATATAVMKGHLLSDYNDVFNYNGQQHLVRDYNGYYHLFYVSMGKIWHTKSLTTNFDGAWSQEQVVPMEASFDTPISISVDAANVPGPDSIAIAYTDGYSLGYTTINAATNALISTRYVQTNIEYGYGAFVKPVVAYTKKELMVIYRASASGGLYCSLKYKFYDNDPWIYSENNLLPHTGFTSSYPTIAVTKTGYSGDIFHIAFQEGNLRPSIMYGQLPEGANLSFNPYPISETSGFTFNSYPSISLFYLGNNVYKPLVSWTASNSGTLNKNDSQQGNQIPEPRMICRPQNDNGAWGDVFSSGQSVNFSANNSVIRTNTRTSVIAWSQSGGTESKWVRRENSTYSGATCLEPAGLIPNISTGSDLTNIKAVSSDASTMPAVLFPAVTSFNGTPICSGNQKVMLPYTLTYSRSGVILKNGIEFVFNTGDIINSDTVVKFKEAPDTIIYNSPVELNSSLITQDFHLNQNSVLLFTNYYYVINKEAADSLLSGNDAVSFKVELVNSSTNQVAGTFDNITFSKENLDDFENVSYEIDCSGISEGEYFLRIVTSQIGDASYSLINTQNDASNMAKKSYNKVAYSGEEIPLKYDLSQNYPNPFNPATTINYQLPQNGYVTLKIYDILGSEVSTLVNEPKNQGRYSVNFDASRLASGVYIYRLQVNDYVSSKKMLLLK